MRYWFIFITFFFLPLEITYSQADKLDQTIRLSLSNANPINVISEINRQTGLNLAFESALLNSNQKFSFDGSENKLINVLNKLFSGTETSFSIIANQVIAIKKDPNQNRITSYNVCYTKLLRACFCARKEFIEDIGEFVF